MGLGDTGRTGSLDRSNAAERAGFTVSDAGVTAGPDFTGIYEGEPDAAAHRNALAQVDDAAYIDSVIRGREFWEFIGAGNGTPGAELGTELVESAASQASVIDAIGSHPPGPYDNIPITVRHAGESMLDVAACNHDVSARVLTGDLDGDGRTDIQRDDILTPLFTHPWDDGGESAGRLTNWMTHEMGVAHAAGDTSRVDRAEHAALGLAQYLSHKENFDRLMDVHGENTSNIGEVNPDLVRAFADGLHGYIPELIGADGTGVWKASDLEPVDSFGHAQRVFTLMATDAESSATFGSAATTFRHYFAGEFMNDSPLEDTDVQAAYAGRLQALLDTGIYNAADEMFDDRTSIEEYTQQRRSDTYNTNYSIVRNLVALDPRLSGTIGLIMDAESATIRDAFLLESDPEQQSPFTVDFSQYGALNAHNLLENAVAHGGLPPEAYMEALRFKGVIDEEGQLHYPANGTSAMELTATLNKTLEKYGVDYDTFRSFYIDGYNQVTSLLTNPIAAPPR